MDALFAGLVELGLPHALEDDFRAHLTLPDDTRPPFGMSVPARLHEPVLAVLRSLGVKTPSHSVTRPEPAAVFVIDDDNYVIARDFELDVPEFEHRPEWFTPQ